MRPSLDTVFMSMAQALAARSDCKRAWVGAVVTDKLREVVYGIGYNGGAAKDKCRCTGEQGNCGCVHAEANALIKCRVGDKQKILYSTAFPCRVCAKLVVNAGFSEVYYLHKHRDWQESEEILRAGRVQTFHILFVNHEAKIFPTLLPIDSDSVLDESKANGGTSLLLGDVG